MEKALHDHGTTSLGPNRPENGNTGSFGNLIVFARALRIASKMWQLLASEYDPVRPERNPDVRKRRPGNFWRRYPSMNGRIVASRGLGFAAGFCSFCLVDVLFLPA